MNTVYFRRGSISLRLLFLVVLCSSFFTLMASIYQLFFYYRDDVSSLHENLAFIQSSYLRPIAASLYTLDYNQFDLLLQSAIQLKDVEYIEVLEYRGGREIRRRVGNLNSSRDIVQEFSLEYFISSSFETYTVGSMKVIGSFDNIYSRTLEKALVVIVTNAVKMFLASFCILLIFQFVITRHLLKLAEHVSKIDINKQSPPFRLDREPARNDSQDELEVVVNSINETSNRSFRLFNEIQIAKKNLEQQVEERTQVLSNEVAVRKQAEEVIRASLAEKEVLLKEIHHRVKNNLQVVMTLLSLQAGRESNDQSKKVLEESQRRIRVMARIHESLHNSDDLTSIDIKDFLNTVVEDTKSSISLMGEGITFHLDADDINFDIDNAIACGQIISELVSNSLKHGFPNGKAGNIEVSLHRDADGLIKLAVVDNGKGLPDEFDINQENSLGMKLVEALAMQLNGKINIDGSNGTAVQITFQENLS